MVQRFDYLVIGSGIAGMSFALKVANEGKSVALICKAGQEEANTYFAQGGIASVTNLKVDNFEKHIEDTMIAGDWISDRAAVEKVVREAPAQIEALIRWGVNFDKKESGEFDLHKEGGHSEFRILHHADNTGAEIQTSYGHYRHPPYPRYQMFRCLCIERGYGRGTYFLVKDNRYGDRRLRGRLPEYDKPAGSYRRRYRHGLPCERLRKRYGVHPVPPDRLVSSGRPSLFPHHRGDARIWSCIEKPWRRGVHA